MGHGSVRVSRREPRGRGALRKNTPTPRSRCKASSAARALAAGAQNIERVDRLVQSVAAQRVMRSPLVDESVALVDDWLVRNRRRG